MGQIISNNLGTSSTTTHICLCNLPTLIIETILGYLFAGPLSPNSWIPIADLIALRRTNSTMAHIIDNSSLKVGLRICISDNDVEDECRTDQFLKFIQNTTNWKIDVIGTASFPESTKL